MNLLTPSPLCNLNKSMLENHKKEENFLLEINKSEYEKNYFHYNEEIMNLVYFYQLKNLFNNIYSHLLKKNIIFVLFHPFLLLPLLLSIK